MGVSVSPGSHTVVFVHAEKGRKVVSVNVQPGKTATAAVRF
jgi:serine/threonine-protein kinase